MKAESTDRARKLDICPACGEPKGLGCIVCWSCFKYIKNPLKYSDLPFLDWLATIPANWKAKIARSGL